MERVTERNRTAAERIHSPSPDTSTGPGHSGRHGIRTHMTLVESHGLANRPGEPYPATFRMFQWTHWESNPDFQPAELVSSHLTMSP